MHAALLVGTDKPLVLRDVEDPPVGAGDVLVRIRAAGICDTDARFMKFGAPWLQNPAILGHQIAGQVARVGTEVKEVGAGDRVVVNFLVSCGECFYCKLGKENLCLSFQALGVQRPGGFADYVAVPQSNVIRIPAKLPYAEASLIPCGFATPYRAFKQARVKAGETVVVLGGRLWGLASIMIGHLLGARVLVADTEPQRLKHAEQFGADRVENLAAEDFAERTRRWSGDLGADCLIDFTGEPDLIEKGSRCLRKAGKIVVVGRAGSSGTVNLDIRRLISEEMEVMGGWLVRNSEVEELVGYASQGLWDLSRLITRKIRLPEIQRGFDLMEKEFPLSVVVEMEE